VKKTIKAVIATPVLACAGAASAQQSEPPVAVDTSRLPVHVAVRVQAKAGEGITALRRYVASTRMIYGLDLVALLRDE